MSDDVGEGEVWKSFAKSRFPGKFGAGFGVRVKAFSLLANWLGQRHLANGNLGACAERVQAEQQRHTGASREERVPK